MKDNSFSSSELWFAREAQAAACTLHGNPRSTAHGYNYIGHTRPDAPLSRTKIWSAYAEEHGRWTKEIKSALTLQNTKWAIIKDIENHS